MKLRWLRFAVLPALCLGCGAQVSPDYQGEPLLTVRGQVVAHGSTTARPAEAALVWVNLQPPFYFTLMGTSVAVKGDFPMGFEINVFTPPPWHALTPAADIGVPLDPNKPLDPMKGPAFGFARIVALAANADHDAVQLADILGTSMDTFVSYNSQAIDPKSMFGQELVKQSLPLEAGYHLLSATYPTMEERLAYVRCSTGGVCWKLHYPPGTSAFQLSVIDKGYEECLAATTGATSCDFYAQPTNEDESNASVACFELLVAHKGTDCAPAGSRSPYVPGTPTTVTMGASPVDQWQ